MLEIEELLNERKDYMRETCPAYRLVCAEHEALVEILGSWPGISPYGCPPLLRSLLPKE